MVSDPKIFEKLSKIEERLTNLEKTVFHNGKDKEKSREKKDNDYKGLTGGIKLLINKGFFKKRRELHEVISELEKNGYDYPQESVSKLLRVDFTTKQMLLNKIKDGRIYKYVLRK